MFKNCHDPKIMGALDLYKINVHLGVNSMVIFLSALGQLEQVINTMRQDSRHERGLLDLLGEYMFSITCIKRPTPLERSLVSA